MNRKISNEERDAFERLQAMPDDEIDFSDIPQLTWEHPEIGKFYRPMKQAVSVRIDLDVLAWLKSKGGRYLSLMNSILRERMMAERRAAKK